MKITGVSLNLQFFSKKNITKIMRKPCFFVVKTANEETLLLFSCRQRTLKIIVFPKENDDFQEITTFCFKQFWQVWFEKVIKSSMLVESITVSPKKHQKVVPRSPFWHVFWSRSHVDKTKKTETCIFLWFFNPFWIGMSGNVVLSRDQGGGPHWYRV